MVTDFDYVLTDVEESVTKVADLATPGVTYSTIIKFPASIVNDAEKIEVKDLRIEFPKGLEMAQGYPSIGSYDSATGIVTIADYVIGADGTLPLTLVSTRISIDQPVVNGTINYNDAITVLGGGELLISPKNGVSPVQSFNLDTQYNMSAFDVTAFSGAIDKPIDGMAVNPILLNDLPSFLSGEGTNLVLANPQLYLALNNPVSQYNLKTHTGLSIIPVRGNSDARAIELPGGLTINDNKAQEQSTATCSRTTVPIPPRWQVSKMLKNSLTPALATSLLVMVCPINSKWNSPLPTCMATTSSTSRLQAISAA